jgi:hypothetical protein
MGSFFVTKDAIEGLDYIKEEVLQMVLRISHDYHLIKSIEQLLPTLL